MKKWRQQDAAHAQVWLLAGVLGPATRAQGGILVITPGGAVVFVREQTDSPLERTKKKMESNPSETLHQKFPIGTVVEGKVRNLTYFGAFIEIEDGIVGLVHMSNLSWRVKHPDKVLKLDDKVKAIVLAIEPEQRRLSLGVKQLQPNDWEDSRRRGDQLFAPIRCRMTGMPPATPKMMGFVTYCETA